MILFYFEKNLMIRFYLHTPRKLHNQRLYNIFMMIVTYKRNNFIALSTL